MWRVRTVFSGAAGSPWLSTMFFDDESPYLVQDAVTAVGQFWGAVDAHMSSSVTWTTESDVTVLNLLGQATGVESTTPVSGAGAGVSDILPPATQALVRWRTGFFTNNREIRGRTFVPGLTESAAVDGNLLTTVRDDIQLAADALLVTTDKQLVVWSRTHNTHADAVVGTVWSQFAVQRSRRD